MRRLLLILSLLSTTGCGVQMPNLPFVPGAGGDATTPATSTPGGIPGSSGTPTGTLGAAYIAALEQLNAVSEQDCTANNPQNRPCLNLTSGSGVSVDRGLAQFSVAPKDGPAYSVIVAKDANGAWKLFQQGQQFRQQVVLPGDMKVCAEGTGLNLRAGPDTGATIVQLLPDETIVKGEEFTLTEPAQGETNGAGWYRVSAPAAGWVYSRYVFSPQVATRCADVYPIN